MDEHFAVVDAILRRRSIRAFLSDAGVARHEVETVLRCGMAAPSSKNACPWRFHVVDDSEILDRLATAMEEAEDIETYVPHDPLSGRPRPEWDSTVLESAAALRGAAAAIIIENRGVFSRGRQTLLDIGPEALAASITGYGLEVMGVGTAIENMLLAAGDLGLGAAFMGDILVAERAVADLLGTVTDLMGVVILGRPAETLPLRDRPAISDAEMVVWH